MRMKLSITAKLTGLVVLLILATAFAVNEMYIRGSSHILVEQAIGDLEKEAEFFKYPLDGFINQVKDDALLISKMSATRGLIRAVQAGGTDPLGNGTVETLEDRLNVTFTEMLNTRERYLKLRVIGLAKDGREILSSRRVGGQGQRLPEDELQSKGGEAFFKAAVLMEDGKVYLSPPDLERENGRLTEPHVLVLRAAAPLYDDNKKLFGIVVINVDFSVVLREVRQNLLSNRLLYITNAAGDYLLHPDTSKLYATALAHDARIQSEYPWLLPVLGDRGRDKMTHLPDDHENGKIVAYTKYHFDRNNGDNYLGIAVEAPYAAVTGKTAEVERQGLLFSLLVALVAVCAAFFLLRLFIRPLNQVAEAVVRYRKGEQEIPLPTDSPDEIGVLAKEFQAMMRQKAEEEWSKEKLVEISQQMLGYKRLPQFADALMAAVTAATGAEVGVMYISGAFGQLSSAKATDAGTLTLSGSSGFTEHDGTPLHVAPGEGLVGQCARDRKMRLVNDIPDDYLLVASSLGASKPRHLLLLPVVFENTLAGVIELGALNPFTEIEVAFLTQLCFNTGVIINSISASMRTEELLEETRMAAEELRRNEEELKTQQEELEASNEEMEEKTKALEEQNAQIRQKSRELNESKLVIEEKARELELAGKYKSEFLANMSHELRTPLNSLLILARSLAANEEGNLTAEQVEEARIIHNGGLELLTLINDILDLSKVEAGKLSIVLDDANIAGMVRRLEQQFEPVVRETGLAFNIAVAPGMPSAIYTDAQRVEQIIKNLLSNAFKFTERGSVTLSVARPPEDMKVQRADLDRAATVAFSVTDTGIGIDAGKLNAIFEAFQQEDGSTDRHYGGTGLGLTIARKFAHMMGGEIHVASKKGQGSTFTLLLPERMAGTAAQADVVLDAAPEARRPAPQAAPEAPRIELSAMPRAAVSEFVPDDRAHIGTRDRVLLVIEDDKAFAQILMKTARQRGYKALAAGDGKSGILMAVEYPVSAIILDLKLPDLDGMTVLDQLKHDLRTRHIPVHIISGRDAADLVAPLRKGAIGFSAKPVHAEGLDSVFARIEEVSANEVKKILVVEDDRKTQAAIQSLLKKKDVDITCLGHGSAALAKVAEERFDCVILDLQLPDMTGFEWLDRAEEQSKQGQDMPPVIVYTARELTRAESQRLGGYTGSIVIKGAHSSERLLDEVTLFLHSVESSLSKDQQAMIRMQHNPDRMLQDRKILLVDDDMRNTFALSKVLKKHGMQVVIADNGQMALDRLAQDDGIELVIMDIMMPVMDGYEAMRAIRSRGDWQGLPVIALTARAMPEEQEKCLSAGANDYLVKPVDVERLLTLLRVWLFRQDNGT